MSDRPHVVGAHLFDDISAHQTRQKVEFEVQLERLKSRLRLCEIVANLKNATGFRDLFVELRKLFDSAMAGLVKCEDPDVTKILQGEARALNSILALPVLHASEARQLADRIAQMENQIRNQR